MNAALACSVPKCVVKVVEASETAVDNVAPASDVWSVSVSPEAAMDEKKKTQRRGFASPMIPRSVLRQEWNIWRMESTADLVGWE